MPETGPKELYIVSRFVQQAHEHDRPLFEDFIVLVKGQMYANALTCPDLQSLQKKFDRVTFYLDTALVLNLLGLQGQGARQAAQELTTLLLELRGTLAVFEHNFQEIKGAIRYAIQHVDDRTTSTPILREVRNSAIRVSDLMLCLEQLHERLSVCGIRIKSAPPFEQRFQIDEPAFQDALQAEIHYSAEHTMLNDINSVRAIYVLRRDVEPARLEDAVAVLVTTNVVFARVAFEFGKWQNSSKEVSGVVTDYSLANVAWLKAPMKRPSLPEKETLALCFALLEPSKELFGKYVNEMDRLRDRQEISEEDHAILRLSSAAHRELMNLTLGDEEALTGNGVRQILDRVKKSLIEEQKRIAEAERVALERVLGQQQDMYRLSQKEKDQLAEEQAKLLLTTSRRARLFARWLTLLTMTLFSIVLLIGAATGSGLLSREGLRPIYRWLIFAGVLVTVCWGWFSWITGKTVRQLTQQIQHRVTLKLFTWLTGRQTPPEV